MLTNRIVFLFTLLGLVASCQPKEKFDWEVGLSAPKYYSSSPKVQFFYKDKIIHGASTNIGIQPGWGETSGGYASGKDPDEVPDSLHVEWLCGSDRFYYKGDFKLPRKRMLKLFQNPVKDEYNEDRAYTLIVVGTAPGGNVTVWMQAGSTQTEIGKFKAQNKGIWKESDHHYNSILDEAHASKEFINGEYNVFHYLHGIPYSVWGKNEKKYDYDTGFMSQDNNAKGLIVTFFNKDGSWHQSFINPKTDMSTEVFSWNNIEYIENNNNLKKRKLPVQIYMQFELKNEKKILDAQIIMPQNFEKLISEAYRDSISGKKEFYNRILIGVYNGNKEGTVWLTGKNKKMKLLNFILYNTNDEKNKENIRYSLPQDFKFPKWQGREKLIAPDKEIFWKEN
ncbi:DUF2931 family protein [Flavobacterium sp. H122]|uniref:DUF2931 family protein n=1 Tax=Flavobacterium sp. H122 TaxID=2529860 RepID=UPI0010AB318C|nr:DUF2931 family protein [Flavobacterium sp. H122]